MANFLYEAEQLKFQTNNVKNYVSYSNVKSRLFLDNKTLSYVITTAIVLNNNLLILKQGINYLNG